MQHAQKKHEHRVEGNNEEACATDATGEGIAAFTKTAGVTALDEDKSASLRGREQKSSSSAGSGTGTGTDTGRAEEKEPLQAGVVRDSSTAESSGSGSSAGAKMAMSDKSIDSSSKGSSSPINAHTQRDGGSSKAVQRVAGTLNQPLESARRSGADLTINMSDRGVQSAQREGDA